ncbi:sulfotransferase family protein [Desulfonema magnum]|uniref:Sulfotransferase domain-containing protein n=1 Tax=Desulfonema magnum TaxID=45655 RepID=A0A975BMN3_9BACT|nr:sulfotransferase family protein [Desulfonema magnum]QTA87819.1 Sulfotransferase domain-containing protein [Desulfonema magnum]
MIKVIDVALGRTGTMSLKYALESLGFDKCCHFSDMFSNPEHLRLWKSLARGEKIDWERAFEGCQASVYWPPGCDYTEFLKEHPDVRVVLTIRDTEKWYKSVYDTIYKFNHLTFSRRVFMLVMGLFRPGIRKVYDVWQFQQETLWMNTYKGKFHDKKFAIEVFAKHIEEVKRKVPADRLLIFDVKDGWEPLCRFLDVPVPDTPFPRVNDTATFIEWRTLGLRKLIFGEKIVNHG